MSVGPWLLSDEELKQVSSAHPFIDSVNLSRLRVEVPNRCTAPLKNLSVFKLRNLHASLCFYGEIHHDYVDVEIYI